MANAEPIRKLSRAGDVRFHAALSDYEARCLCRRLADCEAGVQQAFMCASEALLKTRDAPALARICAALEATLRKIGQAKQLGLAGLMPPADKCTVSQLRYRIDRKGSGDEARR